MYYDYNAMPVEYDEFVSNGGSSINPILSPLQEAILLYLKELAYYLLKLKELGATNDVIKENIMEAISGIITHVDYNQEQFQRLMIVLGKDLSQAKVLYSKLAAENNVLAVFLKSVIRHRKKFDMTDILKKGQRHYVGRNTDFSQGLKDLFDVVFLLVKNFCIKIIQIKSYNKNYDEAYDCMLVLLNQMNYSDASEAELTRLLESSTSVYQDLMSKLSDAQEERYGERESPYIKFSPRSGKAILVSGIDMTQLEAILEATKGKNVDVYTHGLVMLMAHTLPKFKKYTHLVGHYGKSTDNCLFDFATFPGAILTTRYLFQKTEYFYRGRLFTTDSFAPSGIIKIVDNNFEPLIKSALEAKGFTKKQREEIARVGFRQKQMEEKVKEVIGKMAKNELKHLYIIGLLNSSVGYKDYFDKFLSLMPNNCYALSLSYDKNAENILHVDSFYDYIFIYKVLEKINENHPLSKLNITIFITKCDQYTITNIINFVNMGIKNIYLSKCIPSLISPRLAQTLNKSFGVKEFSDPQKELSDTLQNK